MLHLITNTNIIQKNEKKFNNLLKENNRQRREVFLLINGKMEIKKVRFKGLSKNTPLVPDKFSLWYSRVKYKRNINYYFGLGRDGPLRFANKSETPLLKGKLITTINLNSPKKSNLFFAKDDKNEKTYLLLKISMNKLNKL